MFEKIGFNLVWNKICFEGSKASFHRDWCDGCYILHLNLHLQLAMFIHCMSTHTFSQTATITMAMEHFQKSFAWHKEPTERKIGEKEKISRWTHFYINEEVKVMLEVDWSNLSMSARTANLTKHIHLQPATIIELKNCLDKNNRSTVYMFLEVKIALSRQRIISVIKYPKALLRLGINSIPLLVRSSQSHKGKSQSLILTPALINCCFWNSQTGSVH